MASREKAKNQSKRCYAEFLDSVIQVKYLDHVHFRNTDGFLIEPSVRILVGWLITDCTDYIRVYFDQSIERLPGEKYESGFIILKSNIIEVIELPLPHKSFKHKPESDSGHSAL